MELTRLLRQAPSSMRRNSRALSTLSSALFTFPTPLPRRRARVAPDDVGRQQDLSRRVRAQTHCHTLHEQLQRMKSDPLHGLADVRHLHDEVQGLGGWVEADEAHVFWNA